MIRVAKTRPLLLGVRRSMERNLTGIAEFRLKTDVLKDPQAAQHI